MDLPTSGTPCERRELKRGELLFRAGDASYGSFLVERGRLRLERPLADGSVVTLHVARAGESFAEASLFSDRYHCDAVAETASRVAVHRKEPILAALAVDPGFAVRLADVLAQRLRTLRALLEIRNVRSADERVLQYLRFRSLAGEGRDDRPVRAIATEVGLSEATLYRVLGRLEARSLIERRGRRIRVREKP